MNYLKKAVYCNSNLIFQTLVVVITTSKDEVSVRATILLGQILHLANSLLPVEIAQYSHCLPTLVKMTSSPDIDPQQRDRANRAVKCLDRLHSMKRRGPVPYSLYLDAIVQRSSEGYEQMYKPLHLNTEKLLFCFDKNADHDVISQAIRESGVLSYKEFDSWNWQIICSILKWPDEELGKLEDEANKKFIRRIVNFFKPTSRKFSTISYFYDGGRTLALAGCHLVDFLLDCDELEGRRFSEDWLDDIAACIEEIKVPRATANLLFSPDNVRKNLSQYYFLFIGRFSASLKGEKLLKEQGVFHCLLDLMTISQHDTYVKLIVSTLDYSRDGFTRVILSRGLTATSESARLYITTFMRVLLRARSPFFSSWGIEKLVQQLCDQSKPVVMEALSVLNEACEEQVNINNLVSHKPAVLHLGAKGELLLARFLSVPAGFQYLSDMNYVQNELDKWHSNFNLKYVHIVEECLNDALMVFEKAPDGTFARRSQRKKPRMDAYVPVHLYGELVQHKVGFDLLNRQPYIRDYFNAVRRGCIDSEDEILRLKASLWVVGHICTSVWGINIVKQHGSVSDIVRLAEECPVYSVRGTAFYVLGLVGSTSKGAILLQMENWLTVRHKGSDVWPVVEKRPRTILESHADDRSVSSLSVCSEKSGVSIDPPPPTIIPNLEEKLEKKRTERDSGHGSSKPASFYLDTEQHSHSVPVEVKILQSSPTTELPNRGSAPAAPSLSHNTSGFSSQDESPNLSPQASFVRHKTKKKVVHSPVNDEEGYAAYRQLRKLRSSFDIQDSNSSSPLFWDDMNSLVSDVRNKRVRYLMSIVKIFYSISHN